MQDGRIYIELINGPFLFREGATPAEYKAGLDLAIERGWLVLHEGLFASHDLLTVRLRTRLTLPMSRIVIVEIVQPAYFNEGVAMNKSALLFASLMTIATSPAVADPFLFNTGNVDGLMAAATRPSSAGKFEIEAGDDFIVSSQTQTKQRDVYRVDPHRS